MNEHYISLERAIERMYAVTEECGTENIYIDRIVDELENLPSCPDICVHPQWIPVTEREPVIDCLTIDDHGQIELARSISIITLPSKKKLYLANERAYRILSLLGEGDTLVTCTHITHWMPLPERPNE